MARSALPASFSHSSALTASAHFILDHCRDERQVHARGCQIVDVVLGKA